MQNKTLKFQVGQRVDYFIVKGSVRFSGTIIKAENKRGLKPYTILTDDEQQKYANEAHLQISIYPTPAIEKYKGYQLRTVPNGTKCQHTLIYKDGIFLGGTASMKGLEDSIEKAKIKVDYHIQHGELKSLQPQNQAD